MDSVKENLSLELSAALVSALYERFPDVSPFSYMFLYGACSMSSFVADSVLSCPLPGSVSGNSALHPAPLREGCPW